MSRASRRKARQKKGIKPLSSPKNNHWVKWIVITCCSLLFLVIISVAGSWLWFRNWLNSPDFRMMVSQRLTQKLNAPVIFGQQSVNGGNITLEDADIENCQFIKFLTLDQIQIDVDTSALWQKEFLIQNLSIAKAEAQLDFSSQIGIPENINVPKSEEKATTESKKSSAAWYQKYIPTKYILTKGKIHTLNLNVGAFGQQFGLRGGRADFSYDKNKAITLNLEEANIHLPYAKFPLAKIESLYTKYQNEQLFINLCEGSIGQAKFRIDIGDWNSATSDLNLSGGINNLDLHSLIEENWINRISGTVSSEFRFGKQKDAPAWFRGKVKIDNANLTALPILDNIAAFAMSARFRNISFDICEGELSWTQDKGWRVDNLILGAQNLIRVEGSIACSSDEKLSGRLWIGLPPGTLAHIPGSEDKIFLPTNNNGKLGLYWAPLTLSGTLDNPKEDLSDKIVQAAGERLFEMIPGTSQRVLRFSRNILDTTGGSLVPNLKETIKHPEKIIKDPGKILEEPTKIIEGTPLEEILDIFGPKKDEKK